LMNTHQKSILATAGRYGLTPFDRERIQGSEPTDDGDQPLQPTYPQSPGRSQKTTGGTKPSRGIAGDALGPFVKFPSEATDNSE